MKKRIFRDFAIVICVALAIGLALLYFAMSSILLEKEEEKLLTTLKTLEYAQGDILQNDAILKNFLDDEDQRLTVLDEDGTVLLDSGADSEKMENHLQRQEVKEALQDGVGYEIRFSDTVQENMLYVAYYNASVHQIYRIATTYKGIATYGSMFIPIVFTTLAVALLLSLLMAKRFADSLSKPLEEIVEEIEKISDRSEKLVFQEYDYEELRKITSTLAELQEKLNQTLDRLEKEKVIRSEFFSNASHELKTPLTSIRGYAELLDQGMVDPEQYAKCVKRILLESDHMIALINDILMISRLEGKHRDAKMSVFDLKELVQDVIDAQRPSALKAQIMIHENMDSLMVNAAKRDMQELSSNLISNAIKYNRKGGSVEIELKMADEQVMLIVEDSGIGMSEENTKRVFERFYRVDEGRNRKVGGSGLGLSIVKHIVQFYGGTISLHSKLGVGTQFVVKLPISIKKEEKCNESVRKPSEIM